MAFVPLEHSSHFRFDHIFLWTCRYMVLGKRTLASARNTPTDKEHFLFFAFLFLPSLLYPWHRCGPSTFGDARLLRTTTCLSSTLRPYYTTFCVKIVPVYSFFACFLAGHFLPFLLDHAHLSRYARYFFIFFITCKKSVDKRA